MIANLEPYMRSKLDAIHLLALFEYPLMEVYGINDILSPFCDELKELSKVKLNKRYSPLFTIVLLLFTSGSQLQYSWTAGMLSRSFTYIHRRHTS